VSSDTFDTASIPHYLRVLGFSQKVDGMQFNGMLCHQAADLIESQKRKIDELQAEIDNEWKKVPI
jgi:hypothetical protein